MTPARESVCLAATCHDPAGAFAGGIVTAGEPVSSTFAAVAVNATSQTSSSTIAALSHELPSVRLSDHGAGTIGIGTARRDALALALEAGTSHIAYSDLDHVLRWADHDPDELAAAMTPQPGVDLTVIGRSPSAFANEPRRLQDTEGVVNHTASLILGTRAATERWDFMIAVRLMTRATAQLIVEESTQDSISNDVDWPLLAVRHGRRLSYLGVDGLAYRFRDDFGAAADDRDADPSEWVRRLQIAAQHAIAMTPYL